MYRLFLIVLNVKIVMTVQIVKDVTIAKNVISVMIVKSV